MRKNLIEEGSSAFYFSSHNTRGFCRETGVQVQPGLRVSAILR